MAYITEYIWLDGYAPTPSLRSKAKIVDRPVKSAKDAPEWAFDGSSTNQAEGKSSDCILKPVRAIPDPIRGEGHALVFCEVFDAQGRPHASNTRARLREIADVFVKDEPWFGIEQEYTLMKGAKPLAWPAQGEPGPQGPYYCGVGEGLIYGRPLVEAHLKACLAAGLKIAGINAEVMPGQWEFQVGPSGPLEAADELWLSRWLLHRLGEDYGITVSFSPKPMNGDWNGAGAHTNFSTKAMREPGGIEAVKAACEKLRGAHAQHIAVYGAHNEERLTGKHETSSINDFRYGVSDRGASVRIPMVTVNEGRGYFEDRRPAANMDPYLVCAKLIETVCGNDVLIGQEELLTRAPA